MGGNPPGHIIPGTALLLLALHVLLSQIRIHNKSWTISVALWRSGWMQVILGGVGIIVEIIGGLRYNRPFQAKEHLTMYALYMFSGTLFLGESRGRFAEDTWKGSLAIASFGVALLFYVHSQMQMMEEHNALESFVHWLLALACFGSSTGFTLSWAIPQISLGALYFGLCFLIQQALWFYFLAYVLYSGDYGDMGEDLSMGDATAYFVWFSLLAASFLAGIEFKYQLALSPASTLNKYSKVVVDDAEASPSLA